MTTRPSQKPDTNRRTFKALPLTGLVGRLVQGSLRKRGFNAPTVIERWPEIVGTDIAKLCSPLKLAFPGANRTGGTLHLAVPGGAAATLLQPQCDVVLDHVNRWLGSGTVTKIQIHQGAAGWTPQGGGRPIVTPPVDKPATLDEALDSLGEAVARRRAAEMENG